MAFEEIKMKDETELENAVITHADAVESGLVYLDHQKRTEGGRLDVLCVDQDGVFVVMELKNKQDDAMLLQVLEYLDYVNENKDRFASFYNKRLKHEGKDIEIDKAAPPRIMLVASGFSDALKKCVKYVDEDYEVSLKQFKYLRSRKTGEAAPYFFDVAVEAPAVFEEPKTFDDHINKIADSALRENCLEVIERIKGLGPGVEYQPAQYWVGFFRGGRRFAILVTRKSVFHLYVTTAGGKTWQDFPQITVKKAGDLTPEFFDKIRQRYLEVGG